MTPLAAHAAIRFGLGARPEAPVPADPHAWLTAQIRPLPEAPGPSLAEAVGAIRERRRDPMSQAVVEMYRTEALAWCARMVTTPAPFAERWANFWTNHLTTSRRAGQTTAVLGHYQREAIRANAFGRFEDMLLAAYRHPAMLLYLDQSNSVGPNSPAVSGAMRASTRTSPANAWSCTASPRPQATARRTSPRWRASSQAGPRAAAPNPTSPTAFSSARAPTSRGRCS
jgi:uncharacterized protein (DUF1800 family)